MTGFGSAAPWGTGQIGRNTGLQNRRFQVRVLAAPSPLPGLGSAERLRADESERLAEAVAVAEPPTDPVGARALVEEALAEADVAGVDAVAPVLGEPVAAFARFPLRRRFDAELVLVREGEGPQREDELALGRAGDARAVVAAGAAVGGEHAAGSAGLGGERPEREAGDAEAEDEQRTLQGADTSLAES
jgi:hypothetical protein